MPRDNSERQIELRLKAIEKNAAWIRNADLGDTETQEEALDRLNLIKKDRQAVSLDIVDKSRVEVISENLHENLFGDG